MYRILAGLVRALVDNSEPEGDESDFVARRAKAPKRPKKRK
jgi:hypothetical protein